MTAEQTFVIVGASLAGAKAAETLRHEGFDGRLVLVGAEDERPYERPPLSKDYLRGEAGRDSVYVHDEGFYAEHDIELRLGRTAVDMSTWRRRSRSTTASGCATTGCCWPPAPSRAGSRSPAPSSTACTTCAASSDSDALRERLDRGGTVVVVGAGWIGAEVAASARQRGLDVTVVDPDRGPAGARAGPRGGRRLPRHPRRSRRADAAGDQASRPSRATAPSSASARATGAQLECDFVVVGDRRAAAHATRRPGRPRGRRRDPRRRAPADQRARRVRGRRRRRRPAPVLRRADPRRALGQRPPPGPGRRAQHARRRPRPTTACRTSSPTSTTSAWSTRASPARGTASSSAATPPAASSSPSGSPATACVAGMNVNVWDVVDPIQRLIRERVAVDDRRLSDPDVPLEQLAPIEGGTAA